jgi:hypothetical protein
LPISTFPVAFSIKAGPFKILSELVYYINSLSSTGNDYINLYYPYSLPCLNVPSYIVFFLKSTSTPNP